MLLATEQIMKIVFILSYYSSFKSSLDRSEWNPEGMPAVSKLFETLVRSNIDFTVFFIDRNSRLNKIYAKSIQGFKNKFFIISKKHFPKPVRYIYEYQLWQEVNNAIVYNSKETLIYCDRANIVVGSLFAYLTKIPVVLRLHGVTTLHFDSSKLKWKLFNFIKYVSFKAPFAKVICSKDGTPGELFIDKYFRKDIGISWLNGVVPNLIDHKKCLEMKTRTVLFVSRLDSTKGVNDFLSLAEQLLSKCENIKIVMIGDGPLRDLVLNFCAKTIHPSRFHYLGSIPHETVNQHYLSASFFISFNDLGNLSNTMLEAITNGVIPITLRPCNQTMRDISTYNLLKEVAFFVDRDNRVIEAESIICNIIDDAKTRNRLCLKLMNFSKTNFVSWDRRIADEVELIKTIAKLSHKD
ncbi:MAG: glycosyltransferase family 4 protein [Bacteroidales bacterium]|jgi:glycosyltransferase involved in cell wall biosynthesis|nr:glycosyltransferase family 4 protein [Bacteroidales bacterium]